MTYSLCLRYILHVGETTIINFHNSSFDER